MSETASPVPGAFAEVILPCADLAPTLRYFTEDLGFRVEVIYPAEEPQVASLSGLGLRLRLQPGEGDPGAIRIACRDGRAGTTAVAPNGTRIQFVDADPPLDLAPLIPAFVLTRCGDQPESGEGRAGMLYRDLIPDRLGGRFIASHITIPEGGPVSDWVHFHKIRFQMIFCRKGWVRLVYEDQGEPFILAAGDCVLQPPQIRHRVLESSPGLEVVEIGCPALHETLADHDMPLPTGRHLPERDFGGQLFLRHISAETPWRPVDGTGFDERPTGMAAATRGVADAVVLRPSGATTLAPQVHDGELLFGFVLDGTATLTHAGEHRLAACDAFAIPAGAPWGLTEASSDFRLLKVVVP